jgi:hypothetical protein
VLPVLAFGLWVELGWVELVVLYQYSLLCWKNGELQDLIVRQNRMEMIDGKDMETSALDLKCERRLGPPCRGTKEASEDGLVLNDGL